MFASNSLIINILKFGLILIMVVIMSACGSGTQKWKEEVQLSDGRNIVVERELVREAGGGELATNLSGTKPKEYRIRIEHPKGSGQMIEWHSTKISPQTWPELPLVLDMEMGQAVVYAIVAISAGCEVYSKYVYQNGAWVEEPLPEQFEPHTTNLLFGTKKDLPGLVNLEEKSKRNSGVGYRNADKQVGPTRKVCG